MSETPVSTNFLQPFQIFTQLVVQTVTEDLAVTTILDIFLPVEEPVRDFVLARVGHNSHHTFNLNTREKFFFNATIKSSCHIFKITSFDKISKHIL